MDDLFGDERIQFFLRNRADIQAWAAIEPDVTAAIRELLARAQTEVDERLLATDASVIIERRDNARWERIMARHPAWPEWRGVTLEWEVNVDPFGSAPPKLGFFWSSPVETDPAKAALVERCQNMGLQALGYRVPAGNAWPILRRPESSRDWWHDPAEWATGLVDAYVDLWARVAPVADEVFSTPLAPRVDPLVSRG